MTQKEAFDFLELPETAGNSQIKLRLIEKLEYFQHLSEHAPSDFLRRIHSKNVDKVKSIQQDFFPWSSFENGSEVVLPAEQEAVIEEEDINHTIEIVDAGALRSMYMVPQPQGPVGWLITHNEKQPSTAYPLEEGKNYIGRKSQPGLAPFIVLDNDPYISRVHAVILVDPNKPGECVVMDSPGSNNGQSSKNGTYINGKPSRVILNVAIKENETIQIGVTKLVFKSNTRELRHILAEVESTPFVPTVAIH